MGLLSSIFKRTTPENPSFNLNDEAAWYALEGGIESGTGMRVNANTALRYSPWFRGISLIAGDVGKIRCYTYQRKGEGKDRATKHRTYQLTRYKANEYQTVNVFREQLMGHALSGGNGYAYIEQSADGRPDLWPLDPCHTTPVRENGRLKYVWENDGKAVKLEAHEVLHIKGFSSDGLSGLSVVDLARESLGLGLGAERYTAVTLKNSGRPSIVLEMPGKVKPEQVEFFRKTWESMHSGMDNAHRTAILSDGMTAKALSFSNEDQQLIESRKFQITEVANWLGIPPHKVGGEGRTAYASLEQENQSYLDGALQRWLVAWEYEMWDKLLTEEEKDSDEWVIEFRRDDIVRADMQARANYLRIALGGHPFMRINEARNSENLNPDDEGNTIPKPANMGGQNNDPEDPSASNVKPKGPNSGTTDPKNKRLLESVAAILNDAQRRAVRRLATHAEKAARQPRGFNAWLEKMADEHREAVRGILVPAYRVYHDAHESEVDANVRADEFLTSLRDELNELSGTVSRGALAERVAAWAAQKEQRDAA